MVQEICIMTNAIAFVKCYTNDITFNASVMYNTIDTNKYRGNNLALAINDRTDVGKDISNFKLDNKTISNISKAPSRNKNASMILGFYDPDLFTNKKEPNVVQMGNVYYLALEGSIHYKEELIDRFKFDTCSNDAQFLMQYLKMNFQLFNNPKDAIMETLRYLEGDFSFILYINPLNTVYWYSTTALFTRQDEQQFVISSEPIDYRNYVRSDNKTLYFNVINYNIIASEKFPHKRDSIYSCLFDNTLESVVAMHTVKTVFNPSKILVLTDDKNYLDLQYALQDEKVFSVVRKNGNVYESEEEIKPDIFVDHINIDSSNRVISDIYDLHYRSLVEEPYVKYFPIFQYLRITDIAKLGLYLNIPFNKFKLCSSPVNEYYKDRSIYNCGECDNCLKTKAIFNKIGFDFDDNFIAFKEHKHIDNIKVKNCEHFNRDELDPVWFNRIVDIITKDSFKYAG